MAVDKIIFKTQFDPHERVFCSSGDPMKITYELEIDERGVEKLKEVGKYSLYDEIQSHAASVDINVILEQFRKGNIDVLNQHKGFYADVYNMPKSWNEAYNVFKNAENIFETLPAEVRAKFDNNAAVFISAFGTPEFGAIFNVGDVAPVDSSVGTGDTEVIVDNNNGGVENV